MVKLMTCTTVLLVLATAVPAQTAHDAGHDRQHQTETDGELGLNLDNGKHWATDDSLRAGMDAIREAFEVAHEEYDAGRFDAAAAESLSATVEDRVDFMFANCELPPAADAELHKLLAAALGAADTLHTGDDHHAGLHELHRVLDAYAAHFDHPGWDD